jgi:hypothetical protein
MLYDFTAGSLQKLNAHNGGLGLFRRHIACLVKASGHRVALLRGFENLGDFTYE